MKTYTAPENYTATEPVGMIRKAYDHATSADEPVEVLADGRRWYWYDPKQHANGVDGHRMEAEARENLTRSHMCLCRRLRAEVHRDLLQASEHREKVAEGTLTLWDTLDEATKAAEHEHRAATAALEAINADRRTLGIY